MNNPGRSFAGQRRFALLVFDAASALVVAALLSCAFVRPAWAYVDPSVMTYTIQAIAGVAVALSAVAGVALRRTRKLILKKLNIDENANKDVEAPVSRIAFDPENIHRSSEYFQQLAQEKAGEAGEGTDAADKRAGTTPSAKRVGKGLDALTWRQRLLPSFIVVLFCGFTLGIAAPFEVIAGAAGDLMFGLGDVWGIMVLFTLAAVVALTLLLSCIRGRAFTVVLTVAFCFGLCCYIQALALNGGLPPADGRAIDWVGVHGMKMVTTGIVWLVILVVPAILCLKNAKVARLAVCALSLALILVQGVGVGSLFVGGKGMHAGVVNPEFCTEEGLFDVSPDNNVVVFILDCFDTHTMDTVVQQDPNVFSHMDGFTWYRNNAGVMIPTSFALPYLLTGQTPAVGQNVPDYMHGRYPNSRFLEDLKATGWSIGIYSDSFGISSLSGDERKAEIYDNIDNFHQLAKLEVDPVGTVKALVKIALYRDMPWVVKGRFWFYTDEINEKVLDLFKNVAPEESVYVIDDARYLDRLQHFGLSADSRGKRGSFRLIHLLGAHYPFSLDENANEIGIGKSDQPRQARGALHIVDVYLDKLKALGLYDNSTIMIMSDHGDWEASMDMPRHETEPILLYKPAHAAAQGMRISNAPTSHADFHGTVLTKMGAPTAEFPTTYESISENNARVRPFWHITHDDNAYIKSLLGYNIEGDVLNFANWHYTGNAWPCNYDNDLK